MTDEPWERTRLALAAYDAADKALDEPTPKGLSRRQLDEKLDQLIQSWYDAAAELGKAYYADTAHFNGPEVAKFTQNENGYPNSRTIEFIRSVVNK